MNNNNDRFFRLEQLIQKKHMLSHPFYKAWTCGQLANSQLQEYAKEYYHHVKAFPTYISALHSRCEDMEIRQCLLANLVDEEMGNPNHPELWKVFGLALGVSQEDWNAHQPRPQTKSLIDRFKETCSSLPLFAGIAALYCYESQIPSICTTKIEGLKKWYGMTNPTDYRYFSVHEVADIEHSAAEKNVLMKLVTTKNDEEIVLETAEKVLDALGEFLTSFLMKKANQ